MNYLKKRGVEFDADSLVIKDNKKTAIYFRDEIGGFAFHLMKI
jgi:2-dehydro-3-deoxyphosphogluconate aldolase/(4S)-4-hydroxy-2-oxoglutarate aldolase